MSARNSILPCVFVLLAACGSVEMRLRVISEPDANRSTATALDVVCLHEAASRGVLPKNAADWFQQKSQLRASLATAMDVLSLQIPPATVSEARLPARCGKALFIYVYADYLTPAGQAVILLTPAENAEIRLRADKVLAVSP